MRRGQKKKKCFKAPGAREGVTREKNENKREFGSGAAWIPIDKEVAEIREQPLIDLL